MSELVPVENMVGEAARDMASGAIVFVGQSKYHAAKRLKEHYRRSNDALAQLSESKVQMARMTSEMAEMKVLLQQVLNSRGS